MSSRLNQEREQTLQPKRMAYAVQKLTELGIQIVETNKTTITFIWAGSKCYFYPYSGWHTGKTIEDGRGLDHLLKQLK